MKSKRQIRVELLATPAVIKSNDIRSSECEEVDKLVAHLNTEINLCAAQVGMKDLELYNIWININPPGGYNHLHNHVGSVLSGVYYVDADTDQGNIQFERNDGAEYHIPTDTAQETYYTSTRATYACKNWCAVYFSRLVKTQCTR